jgi:guanylate kinase
MQGLLFIVSAPSGAGKSSLVNAGLADDPNLVLSISFTTRAPRPGEQDGREYHFVDRASFMRMLEGGDFLESAEVHGNLYATSQKQIEAARAAGRDVVLEIDWQGAQQVRRAFPDAVSIFIVAPSIAELRRRLVSRGQDPADVIQRRLGAALAEISHASEFDYVIINKEFNEARRDFGAIVRASRLRMARQCALHPEVFESRE